MSIFDIRVQFPALDSRFGAEPSIREMIAAYYGQVYTKADAASAANRYIGLLTDYQEAEIARLRAELDNAAAAAVANMSLACEKEREADALREGISKALDELDDDGPKAVKYAAQELRAAMGVDE